jgi:tRNA/rRNA methyltransferase
VNNTDALKNIRIVLARPSHPGNIGATARAMKTMGLSDLWLVSPRHFPHPDAVVRAAGADDLLDAAQVVGSVPAALAGCALAIAATARHRELRHDVMDARGAARKAIVAAGHPVAIVFGNETAGLTADEAANCRIWARIPTNPDFSSLNLAAAVQLFAYELRMACATESPAPAAEFAPATLEQIELLYAHLEERMTVSGFYNPAVPGKLELRLRRLLARARLEAEEVNILRGFLTTLERPKRR